MLHVYFIVINSRACHYLNNCILCVAVADDQRAEGSLDLHGGFEPEASGWPLFGVSRPPLFLFIQSHLVIAIIRTTISSIERLFSAIYQLPHAIIAVSHLLDISLPREPIIALSK